MAFLGRRRKAPAGASEPSALDELLSTEQEVAAQLAAAEREAGALTAAARADASNVEREAAAALTAELAALELRDKNASAELVRKLEDESARLVTRYRTIGDAEIGRLAAFVLADITGLAGIATEAGR